MGALISTKNNKRDTKENRNIQNKRDKTANVQDEVLMQSLQQKLLMAWSSTSQEYIYKTKFII